MEELCILPFDHRSTFIKELFGYHKPLSSKQQEDVSRYKDLIWEAFLKTYRKHKKAGLGILVDEEFGSAIIRKAKKTRVIVSIPAEKSGHRVFDFEYGRDFGKHVMKFRPDYAKVLVRYNPGNRKDNMIQLRRLKKISDFCRSKKTGFLFELLVPPTEKQKSKSYDKGIRPGLTVKAIKEVRAFGIEPDIWKLEEMPSRKKWEDVISAVMQKNKKNAKIIILGRAGTKQQVKNWLKIASWFSDIIGFAIGRTIFFSPLEKYRDGKITKKEAVEKISGVFEEFIRHWNKLRKKRAS